MPSLESHQTRESEENLRDNVSIILKRFTFKRIISNVLFFRILTERITIVKIYNRIQIKR